MESKNGWPKIIQGLRSLRPLPDDYWMVVKCYKNGRLAYKFWPAAFQALFYAEFTLTLYAPSDTRYSNPVKNSKSGLQLSNTNMNVKIFLQGSLVQTGVTLYRTEL